MGDNEEIITINFEKLIKLSKQGSFYYNNAGRTRIMIPVKCVVKLEFDDQEPLIINDDNGTYIVKRGRCEEYIISKKITKNGKDLTNVTDKELKHMIHYFEYKIKEDRYSSEYIKIYMER